MSTFNSTVATSAPPLELARPALRGLLHAGAVAAAIGGIVWLLLRADSPAGYVGGAVFGTSLILLYSTSATYHRLMWNTPLRRIGKRADHAMIFVLIGGTYTPFCLDVNLAWGIPMLAVVWSAAGAGALFKIAWPDAPKWLGVALYVALGWTALVATAEVLDHYTAAPLLLLALGGAFYTIGGMIYALGRPDPWPRIFGHHEIFHALVVAGSAVHFAAILAYVV